MTVQDLHSLRAASSSRSSVRRLVHRRSSRYVVAADVVVLLTVLGVGTGGELWGVATTGLAVLFFVGVGLHRPRLSLSALDDAPALVAATLSAFAATSLATSRALDVAELRLGFIAATAVVAGRIATYALVRFCRRRRWVAHRTLVVGAGFTGLELTELLLDHPEYGLEPVGYFDPAPVPEMEHPIPVLVESRSVAEAIREADADVIIVAFAAMPERDLVGVLRACDRLPVEMFVIPRLYELLHHRSGRDIDSIWGVPVIRLRRGSHRSPSWPLKRAFDLIVAGVLSVVLLPVIVVVALVVRVALGPGVLFRQERMGLDGRRFEILKFRTMAGTDEHDPSTSWVAGGEGLTRTGAGLRRFSLDELPQLWNVLRGDMSLVGPRPERPHFVGTFSDRYPGYGHRHRVPSGMTGLAQVKGLRGDTSIESRARFDNAYIEGWSVWVDLKLLLLTAASVLKGGG